MPIKFNLHRKNNGKKNPTIKIDKTPKILNKEYNPISSKYGKANIKIIKCPIITIDTG